PAHPHVDKLYHPHNTTIRLALVSHLCSTPEYTRSIAHFRFFFPTRVESRQLPPDGPPSTPGRRVKSRNSPHPTLGYTLQIQHHETQSRSTHFPTHRLGRRRCR